MDNIYVSDSDNYAPEVEIVPTPAEAAQFHQYKRGVHLNDELNCIGYDPVDAAKFRDPNNSFFDGYEATSTPIKSRDGCARKKSDSFLLENSFGCMFDDVLDGTTLAATDRSALETSQQSPASGNPIEVHPGSKSQDKARPGPLKFNSAVTATLSGEGSPKPGQFHNFTIGGITEPMLDTSVELPTADPIPETPVEQVAATRQEALQNGTVVKITTSPKVVTPMCCKNAAQKMEQLTLQNAQKINLLEQVFVVKQDEFKTILTGNLTLARGNANLKKYARETGQAFRQERDEKEDLEFKIDELEIENEVLKETINQHDQAKLVYSEHYGEYCSDYSAINKKIEDCSLRRFKKGDRAVKVQGENDLLLQEIDRLTYMLNEMGVEVSSCVDQNSQDAETIDFLMEEYMMGLQDADDRKKEIQILEHQALQVRQQIQNMSLLNNSLAQKNQDVRPALDQAAKTVRQQMRNIATMNGELNKRNKAKSLAQAAEQVRQQIRGVSAMNAEFVRNNRAKRLDQAAETVKEQLQNIAHLNQELSHRNRRPK